MVAPRGVEIRHTMLDCIRNHVRRGLLVYVRVVAINNGQTHAAHSENG